VTYNRIEICKTKTSDPNRIIEQMLVSWEAHFQRFGWSERLALLEQLDEYIEIGAWHGGPSLELSQRMTGALIETLPSSVVSCREQAYIYLNSDKEIHREVARVWLALKDPGNGLLSLQPMSSMVRGQKRAILQQGTGCDKRTTIRHLVNVPSFIAANDQAVEGKLVDVSKGGARVAVTRAPNRGAPVVLHIPLMEPIAASVVWLAATHIGLSFLNTAPMATC